MLLLAPLYSAAAARLFVIHYFLICFNTFSSWVRQLTPAFSFEDSVFTEKLSTRRNKGERDETECVRTWIYKVSLICWMGVLQHSFIPSPFSSSYDETLKSKRVEHSILCTKPRNKVKERSAENSLLEPKTCNLETDDNDFQSDYFYGGRARSFCSG